MPKKRLDNKSLPFGIDMTLFSFTLNPVAEWRSLLALGHSWRDTKNMKYLSLLACLFLAGCSDSIVDRFRDCCADYQEPGFESELAELIRAGESSKKFDELLAIADKRTRKQSSTEYLFNDATGAFSEQGLVIVISVDHSNGTITAVKSAVAAN